MSWILLGLALVSGYCCWYTARRLTWILGHIGTVSAEQYYAIRDKERFDLFVGLNALSGASTLIYFMLWVTQ